MLENISSKYILDNIFGYIKDNSFSLKLFLHSKSLQKKFRFDLYDYIAGYITKIGLSLDNYLLYDINIDDEGKNYYIENFDKQLLNTKLKEDSIKYEFDLEILKKILYDIGVKSLKDKNPNEDMYEIEYNEKTKGIKIIDIYSPFFEILSKDGMLEYFYTIKIHMEIIGKYYLKNDYISAFKNLNESNIKYGAIKFIYKNKSDFDFLTELKIKFNQVKKICLLDSLCDKQELFYQNIYKDLFSFDIKNNLIYLQLFNKRIREIDEVFNNVNDLKSLKHLDLINFIFIEEFTL